jgi:N-acetylmuramoyl-L-alanine amidase
MKCLNARIKAAIAGIIVLLLLTQFSAFAQSGFISAKNFAEAQGIAYQWFPIQKMLVMRKGLRTLKLRVNDKVALVDNKKIILPAAPIIEDGQIMVPATAIVNVFQANFNPDAAAYKNEPAATPENLNTAPPAVKPPTAPVTTPVPPSQTPATQNQQSEAVLVALRHSVREDHTRVVLEFNRQVNYSPELKNDVYRLTISGCRNLVPTRRTNPVGRDIAKLDINSGPNRKGLILAFKVKQSKTLPTIETVANPFRMIISFYAPAAETKPEPQTTEKPEIQNDKPQEAKSTAIPKEEAPEINIEIPLETLVNESFKNRLVVIDPGHGGSDKGFEFPGRIPEKEINLSVALLLEQKLKEAGLKSVLLRNDDTDLSQAQRTSIANKHGGDIFISIHTGGSRDTDKSGVACVIYSKSGTVVSESDSILAHGAIYKNWLESARFDLAAFLARRINERLKTQLQADSRGVKQLPLLPVKFILNPAVVVEVGMLSEQTEGKNLLSKGYHDALAACIANGVIDFFNGIVIKP